MKTFTSTGKIVPLNEEPVVNNMATLSEADRARIIGIPVLVPSEDPELPMMAYVPLNTFATPEQLLGFAKAGEVQAAIASLSQSMGSIVASYAQKTDIAGLATNDALGLLRSSLMASNAETAQMATQANATAVAAEQAVSTRARVYSLGEVTVTKVGAAALLAGVDVIEVAVSGVQVGDVLSLAQTTALPVGYHVGVPIITKPGFVSFQINRPALGLNVGYSFKMRVAAIR